MRRIALIFDYSLDYCRGVLHGVKRYAVDKPDWVFTTLAPGATVASVRRARPAGVIAHVFEPRLGRALRRVDCPVVNVAGVLADLPLPRVGIDDVAVGRAAAGHLLDRGLRRLAFIGHPGHLYSARREAGFRAAVGKAGLTVDVYHDTGSPAFDPQGRPWATDARVRQWVRGLPKPAGIFACNDLWGAQLTEVCRQAGLRVPDEVAIVGVDNDDLLCDLARPSLSSVAVPARRIGQDAAGLLDRLIRGGAPPRDPVLHHPTEVVARQSSDVLAVDDADVAAAVRLIRERAHEPVRVKEILQQVPVSRRSLERRFRRHLGRGLWEEIRRVHMDRARALLVTTDSAMPDVARRAGFTDAKQLSVVFRQETGETPTAYRRRLRGA